MERSSKGKILTFYSYKGGTGRSMALANVAWILASSGKKVLAIDWDLEAPGLHRYLYPFLIDKDLTSSDGLIDFAINFAVEAATPYVESNALDKDWYKAHTNILRYAASLDWEFPAHGTLDFIPPGRQGVSYSARVNSFNWQNFYDRLGGGVFLEAVKERLKAEYDYILIDSRTGVSDTSGICTVQLPDTLVVCFTLNYQSIEGAAAVATSVWEQRRKSDLRILPVAMRVENAEKDKLEERREYAKKSFARFPNYMTDGEREKYWGEVEVMYVPYYAYEELLAPFGDKAGRTSSLLASAERLTSYITNGAVDQLNPPPESLRQEILARYARKPPEFDPSVELIKAADQAIQAMSADHQKVVRRVMTRLVRLSRPGELGEDTRLRVNVNHWTESVRPVIDELAYTGLVLKGKDDLSKLETIELAVDSLIRDWDQLKGWLSSDREFLLWRQQLQANMVDWENIKRDEGALLSGAPLRIAKQWRHNRTDYLNEAETLYITESTRLARRYMNRRIAIVLSVIALVILSILTFTKWQAVRRAKQAVAASNQLINAGIDYLSSNNYDDAIIHFTRAVELKSDNPDAYYNRGLAYYGKRDYSRAITDFELAISYRPSLAEAYVQRGRTYRQKNELDRAIADYDQAIQLKPDSAEAYNFRGYAYYKQGNYTRAREDCNKAITLNPGYSSAYDSLGSIYEAQDNLDRAISEYSTSINLDPSFAVAYSNRGSAYYKKGDATRAIADYTQAIQLRPDYADAYFNRGVLYSETRHKARAIADFSEVIRIDPKYAAAYERRAWNQYLAQNYELAISDYSEVLKLYPNSSGPQFGLDAVYFNRGRAYKSHKNNEEAIVDIKKALEVTTDAVIQSVGKKILLELEASKE